jgi:hypothetical protein
MCCCEECNLFLEDYDGYNARKSLISNMKSTKGRIVVVK